MQNENNGTSSPPIPERSLENPKPDPHDTTISALRYETQYKRWRYIERLAAFEHDQWIGYSMSILPALDEYITVFNSLIDHYNLTPKDPLYKTVKRLDEEYRERCQKWAECRCSFSKLPFEQKEKFRYMGRQASEDGKMSGIQEPPDNSYLQDEDFPVDGEPVYTDTKTRTGRSRVSAQSRMEDTDMKISTFILEVEHEDNEDPIEAVLKNIDFRNMCGDWKDFISTEAKK